MKKFFHIHGDNIVECVRAFDYITEGLRHQINNLAGPAESVTCPVYVIKTDSAELTFQFLPGYGERRWNQDILSFIKRSGGRLREAADAIVTEVVDEIETPLFAIEFCGALPAGNQAWQRQGRAFSFAHAGVSYFYVAELGGFELDSDRDRKAERMPNPAIPFSFFCMTQEGSSVCMPVYEANSGASRETFEIYASVFGKEDFLKFIKEAILNLPTNESAQALAEKCIRLVELLADAKKRKDGLSSDQWRKAHDEILSGGHLTSYLTKLAPIEWKKTAYIEGLTSSAKTFMGLGAKHSIGLTSKSLPLSFVPTVGRVAFADEVKTLYPNLRADFTKWLGKSDKPLVITWVMGFKPRGDDARPDRGLPPLAKMLVGDSADLLTFVYGPAPKSHWSAIFKDPVHLATRNGLWEAVLGVSDGILIDSITFPEDGDRGHLKSSWQSLLTFSNEPLLTKPEVNNFGEQDVDTALHVAFESLGSHIIFEGLCNPPGGDWSGISFKNDNVSPEYRWLTLPRVSADGAKRPDHVFAVFGCESIPICLCIESKETAVSLDKDIGPRLKRYTEALFEIPPSIERKDRGESWVHTSKDWLKCDVQFASAGAFLASPGNPFKNVGPDLNLDILIGVEFANRGKNCTLHFDGITHVGKRLVKYFHSLNSWGPFVTVK
jgi:hypothetical protein